MIRDRPALAARGLRAVAALGLVAALVGVPVEPVSADSTICVGIVVDYGEARPGSGPNSFCARVPVGATGGDVLIARARALARPAPTYRSDGILCTIDGYPNDGSCAGPAPGGGYRFWSYWHQAPGSSAWTCAPTGPNGFTVRDGWVEGWSFQGSGPICNRPPAAANYGSICRALISPTPRSSPTVGPLTSRSATGGRSPASPGTTGTTGAKSSTRPRPVVTTTPPGPATTSAVATPTPPQTSTPSASASAGTQVTALSPVEPPPTSPSRAPIVTLAGLALAGGIGAAAVLRSRRTRREVGG